MVDTCFTARTATKQSIVAKIGRLSLWPNDSGQYTHAAITQLEKGIQRVLTQQYNPAGGANGMLDLLIANNVGPQANKTATAADILRELKKEVEEKATQTGKSVTPKIQNHFAVRCLRGSQQTKHCQPSADWSQRRACGSPNHFCWH